jgi:hypothetical protein
MTHDINVVSDRYLICVAIASYDDGKAKLGKAVG